MWWCIDFWPGEEELEEVAEWVEETPVDEAEAREADEEEEEDEDADDDDDDPFE